VKEENALLTFLKQTQGGKYAKIDESASPFLRLEYFYPEDEYYYSLT